MENLGVGGRKVEVLDLCPLGFIIFAFIGPPQELRGLERLYRTGIEWFHQVLLKAECPDQLNVSLICACPCPSLGFFSRQTAASDSHKRNTGVLSDSFQSSFCHSQSVATACCFLLYSNCASVMSNKKLKKKSPQQSILSTR